MLVLATAARVGVFNAITVHFVPIMVWKGASEQQAATLLLAIIALMSLPGHLAIGWIADRVSKPALMSVCMVIGAAAVGCLANGESTASL